MSDNGCGVPEAELPLLVLPGYTSKLSRHEDLQSLSTYGFRGQALAAVLAVARVTVVSGTGDQDLGLSLSYDLHGNLVTRKLLPWDQGFVYSAVFITASRGAKHNPQAQHGFAQVLFTIYAICEL